MWVCQGSGLGLAQALSQDAWIRLSDERLGCTCPSTLLRPTTFLAPSAGPHKRGTNQTIKVIFQGSRDLRRGQRCRRWRLPHFPSVSCASFCTARLTGTQRHTQPLFLSHTPTYSPSARMGRGLLPPQFPDGRPVRLEKAGRLWRPTRQQFRPQRLVGINK